MSYSGETSFDFHVERNDQEIILKISGRAYYAEGKRYGDPYMCSPDEEDSEILSVLDAQGNSWEEKLTEKEREEIMQQIVNDVSSCDGPDPEDYDPYED